MVLLIKLSGYVSVHFAAYGCFKTRHGNILHNKGKFLAPFEKNH
jgi:hypothetical protein